MKGLVVAAGLVVSLGAVASSPRGRDFPIKAETPVSFAKAIVLGSPVLYPMSIAAGDLNGDGIPDLAVVGDEFPGFSYAMSKGDGHFERWKGATAGANPGSIIFADVDGDGDLDAVSTDVIQDFVAVGFGNGRGEFPHNR